MCLEGVVFFLQGPTGFQGTVDRRPQVVITAASSPPKFIPAQLIPPNSGCNHRQFSAPALLHPQLAPRPPPPLQGLLCLGPEAFAVPGGVRARLRSLASPAAPSQARGE